MSIISVKEWHNLGTSSGTGQLALLYETKEKKNLSNVRPWWSLQNWLYFYVLLSLFVSFYQKKTVTEHVIILLLFKIVIKQFPSRCQRIKLMSYLLGISSQFKVVLKGFRRIIIKLRVFYHFKQGNQEQYI